jgi:hypothetical protein
MNNQFINLFLLLFIINLIGLYIYQQGNYDLVNEDKSNIVNEVEYLHLNKLETNKKNNSSCHLDQEVNRILGPVHNFHEKFNEKLYNLDDKFKQKNADPLGWRKRYILKNNKYLVPEDKNFEGILTKNYLNQLENTDNLYRKGCQ